jgi:hypothetical protein
VLSALRGHPPRSAHESEQSPWLLDLLQRDRRNGVPRGGIIDMYVEQPRQTPELLVPQRLLDVGSHPVAAFASTDEGTGRILRSSFGAQGSILHPTPAQLTPA